LDTDASLSCLELRAPFDCTVESRVLANNERVEQGSPILVLANTQSLYVSASLRDDDWKALALQPGTKISVVVPALENRESVAQLQYVGREVQANTSAVPLIATVDNQDQLLRPGMFVRVTLPIGPAREAIAVPVESILQHEQKSFVFLEGAPGTYQRVDVVTGQTSRDWIEITAGLRPGQRVVTRGAFLLKSELLLQGEGA
jgi:cobalt-zinc-cadmium efflux system membrane fusion protein